MSPCVALPFQLVASVELWHASNCRWPTTCTMWRHESKQANTSRPSVIWTSYQIASCITMMFHVWAASCKVRLGQCARVLQIHFDLGLYLVSICNIADIFGYTLSKDWYWQLTSAGLILRAVLLFDRFNQYLRVRFGPVQLLLVRLGQVKFSSLCKVYGPTKTSYAH